MLALLMKLTSPRGRNRPKLAEEPFLVYSVAAHLGDRNLMIAAAERSLSQRIYTAENHALLMKAGEAARFKLVRSRRSPHHCCFEFETVGNLLTLERTALPPFEPHRLCP